MFVKASEAIMIFDAMQTGCQARHAVPVPSLSGRRLDNFCYPLKIHSVCKPMELSHPVSATSRIGL